MPEPSAPAAPPTFASVEEKARKLAEEERKENPEGSYGNIDGGRRGRGTRKAPRKVRILIKHEGDLSKLGYSLGKSARSRHTSLKKAVKRYGRLATSRKLNALAVFNKRRHPLTARKARADRKFVMK